MQDALSKEVALSMISVTAPGDLADSDPARPSARSDVLCPQLLLAWPELERPSTERKLHQALSIPSLEQTEDTRVTYSPGEQSPSLVCDSKVISSLGLLFRPLFAPTKSSSSTSTEEVTGCLQLATTTVDTSSTTAAMTGQATHSQTLKSLESSKFNLEFRQRSHIKKAW